MKESEVRIEYQYTEAEYLAANRLLLFKSSNAIVRIIVFDLFLLAGAVMMSFLEVDLFPLWAIIAVLIVFEAALFYNILVKMPRAYFRGDGKFRDKYEITFSDEGVKVKTSQIDSKLAWSLYTKVVEGSDMYLLVYGKADTRMMTAVPKRAFNSPDQEKQFRELVVRHIADHSGLKKFLPEESEYTPTSLTPPDWR
jgi:hypothetical protein